VLSNHPFEGRPRIVLTPEGQGSARLQAYIENPTVTGYIIGVSNLPDMGQNYTFTYQVLE